MELAALKILKTKMNLTFPVTDHKRLMEGPLHARCLKTAMMTDHHTEPLLSNNCTATVVSFYESLAQDSARDYQLVAACAEVGRDVGGGLYTTGMHNRFSLPVMML
jgi:hypothetical protein